MSETFEADPMVKDGMPSGHQESISTIILYFGAEICTSVNTSVGIYSVIQLLPFRARLVFTSSIAVE